MTAPFLSGRTLTIESRPTGLEFVGTDQQTLHITCTGDEDSVRNAVLRFSPSSDGGALEIEGPRHHGNNNLHIRIELPWKANLRVRMFAGEVKVEEIKGNKDIEISAGQITISSLHESDYKTVNASVGIGEVHAPVYGTDKGGFFRSIDRKSPGGEFHLYAHVTTGQIDLLGSNVSSGIDHKTD
jgi:hypothetical protein